MTNTKITNSPLFISEGNKKMTLPTFSIPAGKTCPGCTVQCASHCYAKKAERIYPSVAVSRKRNIKATREGGFVNGVIEMIKKQGNDWFRIHESGDFYSQSYLEKWFEIVRACPEVRFLAFTKSFTGFGPNRDQGLDFSKAPKNLEIIWSVWEDTEMDKIPPGPRSYAGDVPFRKGEKVIECPGQCDGCMVCWGISKAGLSVHFKIH